MTDRCAPERLGTPATREGNPLKSSDLQLIPCWAPWYQKKKKKKPQPHPKVLGRGGLQTALYLWVILTIIQCFHSYNLPHLTLFKSYNLNWIWLWKVTSTDRTSMGTRLKDGEVTVPGGPTPLPEGLKSSCVPVERREGRKSRTCPRPGPKRPSIDTVRNLTGGSTVITGGVGVRETVRGRRRAFMVHSTPKIPDDHWSDPSLVYP